MSRVAKLPITIPEGVDITQGEGVLSVKGKLGEMKMHVNSSVVISNNDNVLTFMPTDVKKKEEKLAWAQAGTVRANTANLIKGVTEGWEKKINTDRCWLSCKSSRKDFESNLRFFASSKL
jgi:large subunit ribosomal protein L6